ncbi:MAG: hypothetical protein WCA77_08885 [Thermoplasmata archaeon]
MSGAESFVVGLPEPVERTLQLGPFRSGQDALKFLGYAVAGGLLALGFGPWAWLPCLGAGALVTLPRWEGKPIDRRLSDYVGWRWRRRKPIPPSSPALSLETAPGDVVELSQGRSAAVLVSGGTPTTFLPLEDRRHLFGTYRNALRSLGGEAFVCAGVEPLPARPFLPRVLNANATADSSARAGYVEMVRLLCHRRFRRRVRWVLFSEGSTAREIERLDVRVSALQLEFQKLGLSVDRLEGRALDHALSCLGLGRG